MPRQPAGMNYQFKQREVKGHQIIITRNMVPPIKVMK